MNKDWTGNNASLYRIMGASNHSDTEREKDDFYATDPRAIDALAEKWEIPNTILEPACGSGHLAIRLEQLGHHVIATDKVDRGYGGVRDFFSYTTMPEGCECIITNPPYKFATEFVTHSLRLLPDYGWCAMFVKTTFLEGQKRFKTIFSHYPPIGVAVRSANKVRQKRRFRGNFGQCSRLLLDRLAERLPRPDNIRLDKL